MQKEKQDKRPDEIRFQGRNSQGYGIYPKLVSRNPNLPLMSKGLYAYFCSFAGAGNQAFPTLTTILEENGISKDTYYKYLAPLKTMGLITTKQVNEGGYYSHTIYTVVEYLPEGFEKKYRRIRRAKRKTPFPKISETGQKEPLPKIPDTVNQESPLPKVAITLDSPHISNKTLSISNNDISLSTAKKRKDKKREKLEQKWKSEWGFSDAMIAKAESMADVAQYPLSYMDRVLDDWRSKGIFDELSIPERKERATEAATKRLRDPNATMQRHDYPEGYFDGLYDDVLGQAKAEKTDIHA